MKAIFDVAGSRDADLLAQAAQPSRSACRDRQAIDVDALQDAFGLVDK
ncbi:hypothetical protein [Amycolatopsis sp. FDAARGOS 1241]|nr:hypothetical protein [Amycolatopsis sp. FDAARGOS 1241]QRP50387.1 hypothetical protein I6J71_23460 [Amycolatopsis sp. FDAARGOS 1241]